MSKCKGCHTFQIQLSKLRLRTQKWKSRYEEAAMELKKVRVSLKVVEKVAENLISENRELTARISAIQKLMGR